MVPGGLIWNMLSRATFVSSIIMIFNRFRLFACLPRTDDCPDFVQNFGANKTTNSSTLLSRFDPMSGRASLAKTLDFVHLDKLA